MNSVHDYYKNAYRKNYDVWTHIKTEKDIFRYFDKYADKNGISLELGSGRGLNSLYLAEKGYRVIGIDYIEEVIKEANEEVVKRGLKGKVAFKEANIKNIPIESESFSAIFDMETFTHMDESEYDKYVCEVVRLLKPGGVFIIASFSDKNKIILDTDITKLPSKKLNKYGLPYYFFSGGDIENIFGKKLLHKELSEEAYDSKTDPGEKLIYNFNIFQKI